MYKKFNFFQFLLALVLFLSSTLTVFATNNIPENNIILSDIELDGYTSSCPVSSNGKHLMSTKGSAHVYRGTYPSGTYVFTGYESQCLYCYLVLVTENPAHLYTRPVWGMYALASANETIPSQTAVYTNSIGTKNSHDAFTSGFTFTTARTISQTPE